MTKLKIYLKNFLFKESTVTLTNADSLTLNPAANSIENYLCSEFKNRPNTDSSSANDTIVIIEDSLDTAMYSTSPVRDGSAILMDQLDRCASLVEEIAERAGEASSSDQWSQVDKTQIKQFLDALELLAHVFGFFRCPDKRVSVLERLVKIARLLVQRNVVDESKTKNNSVKLESIYANACIDLMRAYVDSHRCDLLEMFLSEMFGVTPMSQSGGADLPQMGADLTNKPTKTAASKRGAASSKTTTTKSTQSKSSDNGYVEKVLAAYDSNKTLGAKPNVSFYLAFTHYLILKHKVVFSF